MQNIIYTNITMWGLNNRLANMTYHHTWTVFSSVDLILALVLLVHGHLLKLRGDVLI